jgi:hypothetical protein
MSTFLFSYRVPKTYTPGSPEDLAAWGAWFQSMGSNLVDPGKPIAERRALGSCPPESLQGGYSLVTADDVEAALELAERCPGLSQGFGVEVGELRDPGAERSAA